MSVQEGKRIRKPVFYQEDDGDEDFCDFTPPTKKLKSDKENNSDNSQSSKTKNESSSKDKKEGKDDRERRHKDKRKDKKKDKHRDRSRDRDKSRDKHESSKDRDERRERSKERHSSKDKDREKHKDRERRKDKDLKRENSKEAVDKKDGQNEDSSEKRKDEKEASKAKTDETSSVMTSTQCTPSRSEPKPRLTIDEKRFQRELEAALAISKIETGSSPPSCTEVQKEQEDGTLPKSTTEQKNEEKQEKPEDEVTSSSHTLCVTETDQEIVKEASQEHQSLSVIEKINSPIKEDNLDKASISKSPAEKEKQKEEKTQKEKEDEKTQKKKEDAKPSIDEPLPGTSWGLTSKRQRKTVVFKEESDSDSFDGFDDGDNSDFSEGSDFAPSPKKKKGKEKKEKTPNKKTAKSSVGGKAKDKHSVDSSASKILPDSSVSQPVRKTISATKENKVPSLPSVPSKENKVPSLPSVPSKVKPAIATNSVKPSGTSNRTTSNTVKSKCSPMNTGKGLTNSSSNATSAQKTSGLVRTPFRSPMLQSAGSSSKVETSPTTGRVIGLRLGLSRRSNFKPLHPNLSGNK